MDMTEITISIFLGMGAGLLWAVTGFFKGTTVEKFNGQKFFCSMLLGLVIGGASGYMDIELTVALNFVTALGLVAVIENIGKLIYRRISGWWATAKADKKSAKKKAVKVGPKVEIPLNEDDIVDEEE